MKVPMKIIKRKNTLQRYYMVNMQLGLIVTLAILIGAFKADFNPKQEKKAITVADQEEVYIEEIIQTKQEVVAPPPPRPMIPVEVPNDEVLEEEIIEINAELDLDEVFDIPLPPKPAAADEEEFEEEIFVVVEQPPVLVGGIASVQSNIVYPEIALKAGIEGRVIVQFVIDKEGNIVNPVVIRGIGGGCDEEAVRAVKMAKFKPGMQRGRPVSVRYTLPITFKIRSNVNS